MARLPYVDPATATETVRETFEALPVQLNVFRMMAHAETSFRPLLRLGTSILGQQQLDPKLREIIILHVAKLSGSRYEWTQHVPIGKSTGMDDAEIDALDDGKIDSGCFDEKEKVLLRFTGEVVENVKASQATFEAMQQHFSSREIVEALLTVGFYMTVARLLETTDVDIDPPADTKIVDAIVTTE
jgi:alkylhydroperoxidase family enzyme